MIESLRIQTYEYEFRDTFLTRKRIICRKLSVVVRSRVDVPCRFSKRNWILAHAQFASVETAVSRGETIEFNNTKVEIALLCSRWLLVLRVERSVSIEPSSKFLLETPRFRLTWLPKRINLHPSLSLSLSLSLSRLLDWFSIFNRLLSMVTAQHTLFDGRWRFRKFAVSTSGGIESFPVVYILLHSRNYR